MVWADTGVQVSVNSYFDETAFQMLVHNPPGMTNAVNLADSYANGSSLVESTNRVCSTVGLVFGTKLLDTTSYGLDEPIYTQGIKDCEVIFVTNNLLRLMQRDFLVRGTFELKEGEVLVSTQFIEYVYEVFHQTITINSTIDIELLTIRPQIDSAPISELGRMSLKSLVVIGIYELQNGGSLIEQGFPYRMRSNYDYANYDTPVLGIMDSVMILSDYANIHTISETGFFGARSFIRASASALIAAGPDKIADNLLSLKARMQERFDVSIEGLSEILHVQDLVNAYASSMPLSFLNLPVFILALFLSVFAADTFMSARVTEVGALRSKGANSVQIYGVFISESVFMSFVSIVVGLLLSILLAPLIASAQGFLVFDWQRYIFFLSQTVLKPQAVVYSILVCIVPPLTLILYSARKAARTEIGSTMIESSEPIDQEKEAYGFTLGASLILLAMVFVAAVLFPPQPIILVLELALGTGSWFFMAYNGSRAFRMGFARVSSKLTFLLGEKNLIAAGNLRMRKGRVVPLMVVLVLTLSSTIAFTIQAQSFHADLLKETDYAIGADLRISCVPRPFNFSNMVEGYPGVTKVMPVLQTWGKVGDDRITIEALDAHNYSTIGHFDPTSFGTGSATEVLSDLAHTNNGVIISEYHANRWNKTVGDKVTVEIGTRLSYTSVNFTIVGYVRSAPGFGYASTSYTTGVSLADTFGFQARFSGFGITNIGYMAPITQKLTTGLFLGDVVGTSDQSYLLGALSSIPGVSAVTLESFNLTQSSFSAALFLSAIEGLFSTGFAMSLVLSIFAVTLFLGSVVRERRRDYAILRAVGGSKGQIVTTVFSEFTGIVIASVALSLILGSLFGYVMSILVFSASPFARVLPAVLTFPIGFLTVVLLGEFLAMSAGSYLPAREAAKTDPAVVLRNL
jgi:ABC-type antimicrobial peptide transport system permease subunit